MNLTDLIKEINKDIDDSLDNADLIGWINRGLDDLSPVARIQGLHTEALTPGASYLLPTDLMETVMVLADGSEVFLIPIQDKASTGYKVWNKTLTLQNGPESGDLELYYYKRLPHLANGEDIPAIDESFHDLLVLYAVSHSQYADEEPERQVDALNRYMQRKREFEMYCLKSSPTVYQVRVDGGFW